MLSVLTLVCLPIGNLGDITIRAKEKLVSSSWILAEDTRNLKKLLELLGIDYSSKKIDSFHDHTLGKTEQIVQRIASGEEVSIVSDAGSPIISDPAYPLVLEARRNGVVIDTTPGVSSVVTALELSGLPPHPFCFHGFIARDKKKKEDFFNKCQIEKRTHIFFESPHRIRSTLETLSNFQFDVAVTRELTKKFQTVMNFHSQSWADNEKDLTEKGEFVILIYPTVDKDSVINSSEFEKLALEVIDKKAHPKSVAKLLGSILGRNTKEVYSDISR